MAVQKWEYHYVSYVEVHGSRMQASNPDYGASAALNIHGDQGWELVACDLYGLWLKREKK